LTARFLFSSQRSLSLHLNIYLISIVFLLDIDRQIPHSFLYHQICKNNASRLFCFYDETYLCLCRSSDYRAQYFIHNAQIDHCDKCLSGGQCFQGNPNDNNDFLCLCPSCHQGHRCQFDFQPFRFTFDSPLVSSSTIVTFIYLSITLLLFILCCLSNLSCFVTFKRSSPRKFGTGTYLLLVTCLNQIALLCLLLKFIHITFAISSLMSCRLVSYLLSVLTRSTYWLTSSVSLDRIFLMLFLTSLFLFIKNIRLTVGISVATLIIPFLTL
jgi:hypothetical protein